MLLENGHEVVVLEVKSTLRVRDVTDFLADLAEFPVFSRASKTIASMVGWRV